MRPASTLAAVSAALLLTMAGCSSTTPPVPQSPTSAPTTEPVPDDHATITPSPYVTPDLTQFSPGPTGVPEEHGGDPVTNEPVPSWDAATEASALQAADRAMRAFARPNLPYKQWWAEFSPLVTDASAESLSYIDPAKIPAHEVTGPPAIFTAQSAYVVTVQIPTDAGNYQILLIRQGAGAPWLVSAVTPVQKAG